MCRSHGEVMINYALVITEDWQTCHAKMFFDLWKRYNFITNESDWVVSSGEWGVSLFSVVLLARG